jgi:hypothetical protein
LSSIPKEEESNPDKTSPSSFVVLRSRDVVAFLDILPMTGGKCHQLFLYKGSVVSICLDLKGTRADVDVVVM